MKTNLISISVFICFSVAGIHTSYASDLNAPVLNEWIGKFSGQGQYQIQDDAPTECELLEFNFTDQPIKYSMRSVCNGKVRKYWIDEPFILKNGAVMFLGDKVGFYSGEELKIKVYVPSDDVFYEIYVKQAGDTVLFKDAYSLDGLQDGFQGSLKKELN